MRYSKKHRTNINLKNNIRLSTKYISSDYLADNNHLSIIDPSLSYVPLDSLTRYIYAGAYRISSQLAVLDYIITCSIRRDTSINRLKAISLVDKFIKGEGIYLMPYIQGNYCHRYEYFEYTSAPLIANFTNFKIYISGNTVVDMYSKRVLAYTGIKPEYLSYVIKCKLLNEPINNFALVNVIDESLEVKTGGITKRMYDIIYDNFINTNITGIETLFEDGATLYDQIYSRTVNDVFTTSYESAIEEVKEKEELQLEMFEQEANIKALKESNILVDD